jgi:hypothetical protein
MALKIFSRDASGCKPPVEPQCKHAGAQRKQVAVARGWLVIASDPP